LASQSEHPLLSVIGVAPIWTAVSFIPYAVAVPASASTATLNRPGLGVLHPCRLLLSLNPVYALLVERDVWKAQMKRSKVSASISCIFMPRL